MSKRFGTLPKHEIEIPFDALSPVEFLIVALEAALAMEWSIRFVSRSGFVADTTAGIFSSGETISLHIGEHAARVQSQSKGKKVVGTGKNKKNLDHFSTLLFNYAKKIDKIEIHHKFEEWAPKFSDETATVPAYSEKPAEFDLLAPFKPVKGYTVSPLLVLLNGFIFILLCFAGADILWPNVVILVRWGANIKPYTLGDEWWRLVTANFLHFGIIHLFFNMAALIYIGRALEPLIGRVKFLLAYLLSGVTSSILSLWWHDNSVSAGASGAIFGMYGVFFALLTTNLIEKEIRKDTLKSIGGFIVYNLIFGAVIGIVDNAGHLGGLIGGLFLGYCYYFSLMRPKSKLVQAAVLLLGTLIVLSVASFVYTRMKSQFDRHNQEMRLKTS